MSIPSSGISLNLASGNNPELSPETLALFVAIDAQLDVQFASEGSGLDSQALSEAVPLGQRLFLCGIEHLTRDPQGYVYWKGVHVEHFSHSDASALNTEAQKLAVRCLALEKKGIPVTSRTAICSILEETPADSPWLEALCRFYTFFEGQGRKVAILYCYGGTSVAVVERKKPDLLEIARMTSAYDAFHAVQSQGLTSTAPHRSYTGLVEFLESSGITPEDIYAALRQ